MRKRGFHPYVVATELSSTGCSVAPSLDTQSLILLYSRMCRSYLVRTQALTETRGVITVTITSTYHSYAVGWGTLTLINANLAQGKNRSGFAWFLLSLFLGPIATFILTLMPKLPPR